MHRLRRHAISPAVPRPALHLGLALCLLAAPSVVLAEAKPGDPMAYDLRIGVFPVAFQAGMSQSWFGSALRAEYGIHRRLDLALHARLPWANVAGNTSQQGYSLAGLLVFHIQQTLTSEKLSGTLYPEDPPMIEGAGNGGTDHDFDMPVGQRLGGPRMGSDHIDAQAEMRSVLSLRLGFSYTRAVESTRDTPAVNVINEVPMLAAGFGWGTHWNLEPVVTGKTEVGFRRYYIDALATLPSLVRYRVLEPKYMGAPNEVPVGLRVGMEGSIDAFWHTAPGVGFAYTLELGALPGRAGLEGYLLVALGLALDAATR